MKIKKEKQLTYTYIEKIICDKCGNEIKKESSYDAFKCFLEFKNGNDFPEGGNGDLKTLDICQNCTDDLFELLKDNGYNINKSEWER